MTDEKQSVALRPMQASEFDAFLSTFIEDWAADLVKVEGLCLDAARLEAERRASHDLEEGVASEGHHLQVITADKEPVGTLWFSVSSGSAFVEDITVAREHRGRGYGRRALELMEGQLVSLGVKIAHLHVYAHNPRAKALYEKLGFEVVGAKMSRRIQA